MMARADELKWLASLKPGDDAIYYGDHMLAVMVKVTRVTATQIVCGNRRFNRTSGKLIGSSGFRCVWLRPVTDEDREQLRQRRALFKLESIVRDGTKGTPAATLEAMVRLFERAMEELAHE